MVLIIGGAHQGKRDFARDAFGIPEEDMFLCDGVHIDFSRRCVCGIENYVWACIQAGKDPIAFFRENRDQWQDSVLICRDIFCGVVPLEPEARQWRQVTGRLCQYLAGEARQVSRIFCGLEQRLK